MSFIVTLIGRQSVLTGTYFPHIDLSEGNWSVGFIGFQTYNSIPNISSSNCYLHYDDNKRLSLPVGSYDLEDIGFYVKRHIPSISISANNNTLRTEIKTPEVRIDFTKESSIGKLLGFSSDRILEPSATAVYESDTPVQIFDVSTIRLDCNIATNSYQNGQLVHTIHEFFPTVPSGYKIVEIPANILFLPVTVRTLDYLEIRVVDQDSRPINFRGEEIAVRLHFRKDGSGS
jgi:hypothetical protein